MVWHPCWPPHGGFSPKRLTATLFWLHTSSPISSLQCPSLSCPPLHSSHTSLCPSGPFHYSPQHVLSYCPSCVEPSASKLCVSLINGSRLNVPPQTHLLASVTTKSPWSPPSAVPLHHIDQFMFFNAFVCLFPWNEAPIGEAGALSSLFPTASALDAHSTFAEWMNKSHTLLPWGALASQGFTCSIHESTDSKRLPGTHIRVIFTSWQSRPADIINHLHSMATAFIGLFQLLYAFIPSLSPYTCHIPFAFSLL